MAVLTNEDRIKVWTDIMRQEPINAHLDAAVSGFLKTDLKAAVDAIDDWVNTNAVSFNNAIPQPVRGILTTNQKTAMLMYVLARHYLSGF
jgi:hypothetical protein